MKLYKTHVAENLPCYGNDGIACANPEGCDHCGWNPAVAKARLEKMKHKTKDSK